MASPHLARNVKMFSNETFPERCIGRSEPMNWPTRSPDLTPMAFHLWGFLIQLTIMNNWQVEVYLITREYLSNITTNWGKHCNLSSIFNICAFIHCYRAAWQIAFITLRAQFNKKNVLIHAQNVVFSTWRIPYLPHYNDPAFRNTPLHKFQCSGKYLKRICWTLWTNIRRPPPPPSFQTTNAGGSGLTLGWIRYFCEYDTSHGWTKLVRTIWNIL
jgi:hypothetical protein